MLRLSLTLLFFSSAPQTPAFFFKDTLKKLGVSIVMTLVIVSLLLHVIKWGGPHFYFYAWAFCCAASLFIVSIYADYIAPLFDKVSARQRWAE